jgi:hypothetical protein
MPAQRAALSDRSPSLALVIVHQPSRTDARRIAVRAQLLDGIRPVVLAAKVTRELADLASWLDVDLLLPD